MAPEDASALLRELADSPDNRCFVCGPGNPVGLRMRFDLEDGRVVSGFVPDPLHEGREGVLHGGVLTSVLDEAMAYVLFFRGVQGMTGRMEVRYRKPARHGERLRVEAETVRDTRRTVEMWARVLRGNQMVAEGRGTFVKIGVLTPEVLTAHLAGPSGPRIE